MISRGARNLYSLYSCIVCNTCTAWYMYVLFIVRKYGAVWPTDAGVRFRLHAYVLVYTTRTYSLALATDSCTSNGCLEREKAAHQFIY